MWDWFSCGLTFADFSVFSKSTKTYLRKICLVSQSCSPCFSVSIINFEQVNSRQVIAKNNLFTHFWKWIVQHVIETSCISYLTTCEETCIIHANCTWSLRGLPWKQKTKKIRKILENVWKESIFWWNYRLSCAVVLKIDFLIDNFKNLVQYSRKHITRNFMDLSWTFTKVCSKIPFSKEYCII